MIDNVVLIVTGTLHERDVQELLEKCHPLGMFDRFCYTTLYCFLVLIVCGTFLDFYLCWPPVLPPWLLLRICESLTDWFLLTHPLHHTSQSASHQMYATASLACLTSNFLLILALVIFTSASNRSYIFV